MITVKIHGGLGNQMFQYAAAYAISHSRKIPMEIDVRYYNDTHRTDTPRSFLLDQLNITGVIRTKPASCLYRAQNFFRKRIQRIYYTDYHPEILRNQNSYSYLDGFFQSEKYFIEYRTALLEEFSLKTVLRDSNFTSRAKSILENPTSVSIHIRRGDYATNKKTNLYHGLCPLEYYANAINYFTSKFPDLHFFVFSDDIEWVKNNFPNQKNLSYISNPNLTPPQEMHLMSLCTHNIIANSTFSWWGAWLNKNPSKIVVAPAKWSNIIPDPHPNIIPNTWIRM